MLSGGIWSGCDDIAIISARMHHSAQQSRFIA
jgi:hypothetical protein